MVVELLVGSGRIVSTAVVVVVAQTGMLGEVRDVKRVGGGGGGKEGRKEGGGV